MAAIDMPLNPTLGDSFEAQNNVTYVCTGVDPDIWSAQQSGGGGGGGNAKVAVSPSQPSEKNIGDLWYNTNDGILYVWYQDGTQNTLEGQWVDVRPGNEGD